MKTEEINFSEYIIKESEHARKAYDNRVIQTRLLERYSLLSAGIIWSWCATNLTLPAVNFLIWMPSLITFLFGIRAWGNAKAMCHIRDYLITIEDTIILPKELGWGRQLKLKQEPRLAITPYIFWIILQFTTIFIPIFINHQKGV